MNKAIFMTPAVTIFKKDGSLDIEGNKLVFDHLIDGGMDGIVVMGSTGEFFSMTFEEKKALIDLATSHIGKRCKIYIGTGCMRIEETIELSNYAIEKGADGVMIVGPYYFTLSRESIIDYFDSVAKKIKGNIFLYNFPDRTGYDLSADIVFELKEKNSNIMGMKDTISVMGHTRAVVTKVIKKYPDFQILSGFEENFIHNVLIGGYGCIGGLSNLYPKVFSDIRDAVNSKDISKMEKLQHIIDVMSELYDIGLPFIPIIKKAMIIKGINISEKSKEPFLNATPEQTKKIEELIKEVDSLVN